MNAVVEELVQGQIKKDVPDFDIGDTVKVHVRIIEGNKERIQALTGTVIARKGHGISETFSIYRVAYGASMERVFPLHSPRVAKIEVIRKGKTRRSKLYFLRGAQGKKARLAERIMSKEARAKLAAETKAKEKASKAPKAEEKPAEPKAEKPAEPVAEKPEEPKAEKPAEPKAEKPAEPKAEKPAEPKAEKKPEAKSEEPKKDDDKG